MSKIDDHPTVIRHREAAREIPPALIVASRLRQLCLDLGADDVGFVAIDRPEVDPQRAEILAVYPWAKTLVSIVCRMNRESTRSPARSVANLEFHHTGEAINEVAREVVTSLEAEGYRAVNPSMGFPMEMDRFPGRIWVVSHKPIAEAAGMGVMGIHRNVIHPKFGNFILLATIVLDAHVTEQSERLDYNPCLSCKLCVAACPVGAIAPDGHFDFSACYNHNYREFMGGFNHWVEQVAESRDALDYRSRVTDSESASMWQSLSFGANYKAAYCMAVCPAGDDVIGPFLDDRKTFLLEVLNPLQDKKETLYVVPGSDAEAHAQKKFPHKATRQIPSGLKPTTIATFLKYVPHLFQRGQAKGLSATYHFTFTGDEPTDATITIRDQTIRVETGLQGSADLHVRADSRTWIGFLRKEKSLVWALVRRKIRLKGSPALLVKFGKCFPS